MDNLTQHALNSSLISMIKARLIDEIEQDYITRGEAFFHVSGAGHEGIAVLQPHLTHQDYIAPHYRDKSLLLAHGVDPYRYFLALFNKDESGSHGRQMNAHMTDYDHNIITMTGPVGNNALPATGIAMVLKEKHNENNKAITVCNQGEGTTSEGEFLEAISISTRDNLPILFVVEDNKYAISTITEGKTFYQIGNKFIDTLIGCPITKIDGRYPHLMYETFKKVVHDIRENCKPHIIVMSVERLVSHTNADDQRVYRSKEEIENLKITADPIVNLIMHLHNKDRSEAQKHFIKMCDEIRPDLKKMVIDAQRATEPTTTHTAKPPLPSVLLEKANEHFETGDLSMIDSMREVLQAWLEKDKAVYLYGQDIEDPKGDVFGLTRGLSTKFPSRVINSPLSEAIIVGTCIGQALTGKHPVGFLQFADFYPLAFNQIFNEMGSIFWRSGGTWNAPVILLATCGGYKPGLGPFHAAVMESISSHIPGIDVFMPSNAADAAGLLNAAFLSQRPTLFFYPKNQLNIKTRAISAENAQTHVIMPGKARIEREGNDISFIAYGNTLPLCVKVADTLAKIGKSSEIIDLRSMSPLDTKTIINSVKKTKTLLVTHEDNRTASISSEVIARVSEANLGDIKVARVTRGDTFVPCNFTNHLEVLPSYKTILETAVQLLSGTIIWNTDAKEEEEKGVTTIKAVGTSPSDENLTIIKWNIKEGDTIQAGQLIGEGEADKSASDIKTPISGLVLTIHVQEGDLVPIGDPILSIKTDIEVVHTITREETGIPTITFTDSPSLQQNSSSSDKKIYISCVQTVLGNRVLDNKEIVSMSTEWTEDKIINSIGVKTRHWLGENQTLVSIASEAAQKTLDVANFSIKDINGIICATGTHKYQTPSLAAMIQYNLLQNHTDSENYSGYAFDISAACSGFIFALNEAYIKTKVAPTEKILLITAEELSSRVNMLHYATAPVFSDAASASIISTEKLCSMSGTLLTPPILQTIGEPAKDLVVPEKGTIQMNGVEVYRIAVAQLTKIAQNVCENHNITFDDIDLIIPHQANIKIITGIARRLKLPIEKFYINIGNHGNSSSNTIPICLEELSRGKILNGKKVLLIAFGGGYTFAGSIIQF